MGRLVATVILAPVGLSLGLLTENLAQYSEVVSLTTWSRCWQIQNHIGQRGWCIVRILGEFHHTGICLARGFYIVTRDKAQWMGALVVLPSPVSSCTSCIRLCSSGKTAWDPLPILRLAELKRESSDGPHGKSCNSRLGRALMAGRRNGFYFRRRGGC